MSESFEDVIKELSDKVAWAKMGGSFESPQECYEFYDGIIRRLKATYVQACKSEFARGYQSGQRSMDAGRYAVKLRLRQLDFEGGSHENLHKIAYAIYPCATGWTCESAEGLRDELIRLMGGLTTTDTTKSGDLRLEGQYPTNTYDVLGNERHKAACELRKLRDRGGVWGRELMLAVGLGISASNDDLCDRLVHLLGGDAWKDDDGDGSRARDDTDVPAGAADDTALDDGQVVTSDDQSPSITDELREWNKTTPYLGKGGFELFAIADHIDSEFARLLKQQDDAWQATCEQISDECDAECQMYRDMLNDAADQYRHLKHECDELRTNSCRQIQRFITLSVDYNKLQSKLDEYDETHVKMPKDANGECIHLGDVIERTDPPHKPSKVTVMTMFEDGDWQIHVDEKPNVHATYQPSLVRHARPDPIESLVTQHTLGNLDAQELIDKLREVMDGRR